PGRGLGAAARPLWRALPPPARRSPGPLAVGAPARTADHRGDGRAGRRVARPARHATRARRRPLARRLGGARARPARPRAGPVAHARQRVRPARSSRRGRRPQDAGAARPPGRRAHVGRGGVRGARALPGAPAGPPLPSRGGEPRSNVTVDLSRLDRGARRLRCARPSRSGRLSDARRRGRAGPRGLAREQGGARARHPRRARGARAQPGFYAWCLAFGVFQTLSTLALSKALKLAEISLVTALWKVSLLILLGMAWVTIGERPSALGVAGVLLSAGGVYLLNVTRAHISLCEPLRVLVTDRGQRYTLVAALFYAPSVITIK